MSAAEEGKFVVFFDGYCLLCSRFVRFLLYLDKSRKLQFASLTSQAAARLLSPSELASDAIIFYSESGVFQAEKALRELAYHLGGLAAFVARVLAVFPESWQAFLYRQLANNRYRLFGKRSSCFVPTREQRERFLS